MTAQRISLLGLGRVGTAVARRLCAQGVALTVWNRTAARSYAFDGRAAVGLSVAAACQASEIIVLCLDDYSTSLELMDAVADDSSLAGKLLVQLSSGTASDARTLAAWAQMHQLQYLDGAVLAPPTPADTNSGICVFSGPEESWEAGRDSLSLAAGLVRYVGEEIGRAATLECALRSYVHGASLAMLHGAALCESEGHALTEYFFLAKRLGEQLANTADSGKDMIARTLYAGDVCRVATHLRLQRHVQRMSHDNEIDTQLPDTVSQLMKKAQAAGYGDDEITALFEILKRGAEFS